VKAKTGDARSPETSKTKLVIWTQLTVICLASKVTTKVADVYGCLGERGM